ncbi:MAG: hypothetical protein ACRBDI_09525 [Alphaproteobacteria bacterium]
MKVREVCLRHCLINAGRAEKFTREDGNVHRFMKKSVQAALDEYGL